jgi:AAA domain
VQRRGRVLYLDGEMAPKRIEERLRSLSGTPRNKFLRGLQVPGDSMFYMLSWQEERANGNRLGKLTNPVTRRQIDEMIEEYRIDIVVVDHFSALIGGSNDPDTLGLWKGGVEDWITGHRGLGRSFVVLMHEGHAKDKIRGFTEVYDSFDNAVQIVTMPKQYDGFHRFKITGMWERDSSEDADTRTRVVSVHEEDLSDWGTVEYVNDSDADHDGGAGRGRGKLTSEQRERIKDLLREGSMSQGKIAEQFDVSRPYVSKLAAEMKR